MHGNKPNITYLLITSTSMWVNIAKHIIDIYYHYGILDVHGDEFVREEKP